jgi:hypothetical protein
MLHALPKIKEYDFTIGAEFEILHKWDYLERSDMKIRDEVRLQNRMISERRNRSEWLRQRSFSYVTSVPFYNYL